MIEKDSFGAFGGLLSDDEDGDVILVGIPYESGTSGKKGASFMPSALRDISRDFQTISRNGIDISSVKISDLGNIVISSVEGDKTRKNIETVMDHVFEKNNPLITIGGDHSITFPILSSLSKKGKVAVVWIDAHRDLLNELQGSRFSHGSPLRRALELDNINPENVLLVGTRYFTREEEKFVNENKILEMRMVDIENDPNPILTFRSMIETISVNSDFFYISIDIDVLDPSVAPGTGTPVAAGMSSNLLFQLISELPLVPRAFDIVEVSPPLDHSGITVKTAMGLLTEILARIKGN